MTNLPQRIGNYKLERKIGRGGSSEIWLARHRLLDGRQVAIKLLLSQDPEWIERFTREANITSRLRHEHIVQIYDHGEQPPFHYTVMEYVAGGALRDVLKHGRRLPIDLALRIFRCAGEALDYAHAHGVVHRDVSPGNILVEPDSGRVLLTDFGIARESGAIGLTTVNRVMGTPGYLSPEHTASATAVTHLSDVYSLGIVLFETLSGRLPWDYTPGIPDPSGGPFAPPKTLRSCGVEGLPADADRVIQTMLAIEPAKRYPSARAAIDELDRLMKRHTTTTQVVPPGRASNGPRGNAGAGQALPTPRPDPAMPSPEVHPVEAALGPDLLKGPIEEARRRADGLADPGEVARLLDTWSSRGRFRRKLLGRQAALHRIVSSKSYFYTLRVLYETREPAKTVEEPYNKTATPPLEKLVDRWEVEIPAPKAFANEDGGSVRLPGSAQVVTCAGCNGLGRTICQRCNGKRLINAPNTAAPSGTAARSVPRRTAESTGAPAAPGAGAAAVAAAPPTSTPALIPCPDCKGTGGLSCDRCTGAGTLMQQQTITWRRRAASFEKHDDLPIDEKQEGQLRASCKPVEVYREQCRGGLRPEWKNVPALRELLDEANGPVGKDTRVVLSEVEVSFIPMTEVVFDLGDPPKRPRPKPAKPGAPPDPLEAPAPQTYRWYIYGFENWLPDDWRFLSWARVGVVLLSGLTMVLALLLVLALVFR